MIKIQEQKPEIPVEIGALEFSFSVTDESVLRFRRNAVKIQQELEKVEIETDEEKALEQAKKALKKGFDLILGDGAFEKIYEMTPSVPFLMNYFEQLSGGLHQELQNIGAYKAIEERAKKYTRSGPLPR